MSIAPLILLPSIFATAVSRRPDSAAPRSATLAIVCGCLGSVEIEPSVLLPVGGKDTLAFLFCGTCQPSWEIKHVPIDKPPWSVVNREGSDRFKCRGAGRPWPAYSRAGWRPTYSRPSAPDRANVGE